jgi:hypothetical protein
MVAKLLARVSPPVVIGTMLVVVLGTGVSYAADGHPFLLGQSNKESSKAVLSNSGSGAALSLKVNSAATPPLQVSNDTKVSHLNADKLDGLSSASFQRHFAKTVVVSPVGSAGANGAALTQALAGITGASALAPVLVSVEPGTYALSAPLQEKAFVYIRGAGQRVTVLSRDGAATDQVVEAVANSELRDLSLTAQGGAGTASLEVFRFEDGGVTFLRDVTITGDISASPSVGNGYGISLVSGSGPESLVAHGVTVTGGADMIGIGASSGGPTVEFWNGVDAADTSVATFDAGDHVYLLYSEVDNAKSATVGTIVCRFSLDETFTPINGPACP